LRWKEDVLVTEDRKKAFCTNNLNHNSWKAYQLIATSQGSTQAPLNQPGITCSHTKENTISNCGNFFQVKWLCTTRNKTVKIQSVETLHFYYIQDGAYQQNICLHIYMYMCIYIRMHMYLHICKNEFSLLISKVEDTEKSCVNISTLK